MGFAQRTGDALGGVSGACVKHDDRLQRESEVNDLAANLESEEIVQTRPGSKTHVLRARGCSRCDNPYTRLPMAVQESRLASSQILPQWLQWPRSLICRDRLDETAEVPSSCLFKPRDPHLFPSATGRFASGAYSHRSLQWSASAVLPPDRQGEGLPTRPAADEGVFVTAVYRMRPVTSGRHNGTTELSGNFHLPLPLRSE